MNDKTELTEEQREILRQAGKILGGIKSEARANASRENGKKGGRPRKDKKLRPDAK